MTAPYRHRCEYCQSSHDPEADDWQVDLFLVVAGLAALVVTIVLVLVNA